MNEGAGRFLDQTSVRLPAIIDQTAAMVPGDIDGDGDLDIVVLNRGQERVLINDGAGVFVEPDGLDEMSEALSGLYESSGEGFDRNEREGVECSRHHLTSLFADALEKTAG